MSDQTPDSRDRLETAIHDWYADAFEGNAIITSWYVVADGTGFADDAERLSHVSQAWDGDIVQQIGLLRYATRRLEQRMDTGTAE